MWILNTLKKAFNIQSDTQNTVEGPIKGSYSETRPGDWIRRMEIEKDNEKKEEDEGQISEQVQNSPLFIRGNRKDGYFLILGNYKVTQKIEWLWKAREIAEQTDWETVMNVNAVMIETAFKIKESEETSGKG